MLKINVDETRMKYLSMCMLYIRTKYLSYRLLVSYDNEMKKE
jgi:hypothetical protein